MICINKIIPNHKSTQTQDRVSDSAARKCKCNEESILLTVTKESANKGRKFWSCRSARCGFFEWDDEPARTVLPGIMAPRAEAFNPKSGPGSECFKVCTLWLSLLYMVLTAFLV
jgi:DNA topoisomerase III